MIASSHRQRSKDALTLSLQRFSDAGGSLIQIRTREPLRAAMVLREHFVQSSNPYHEWSASTGYRTFTAENFVNHSLPGNGDDFTKALERPMVELRSPQSEIRAKSDVVHYFAFIDPGVHLANNPFNLDLVLQYAAVLPASNVAILFITQDGPLDMLPNGTCLVTELPTPTVEELETVLSGMLEKVVEPGNASFKNGHSIDDEDVRRVSLLGLGLTYAEFETHVALSLIEASERREEELTVEHLLDGIAKGKTEVIRQSEILELVSAEDISNVGGMQRLKDWVSQRADCYSDEAKTFGIEPPKGLVLVGVPGTGKSLVAKAVASELRVPLVRMDFGRVFSKYVGDSEQRVRAALNMVEAMAPCVLFVDEIDKGLGGIGSGGDSGTSMRVLGSYLTWLQELKAPVFNMVTANRVNGLPPELLRRGRFDQIFSVGMPNGNERHDVFAIHLRKRGRSIDQFSRDEVIHFVGRSDGYVPAEIESVVKDALIAAFSAGEELSMDHVLGALEALIPMSKSHAEQIETIVQWATNNAIPVSYPNEKLHAKLVSAPPTRRVIVPSAKGGKA